VTMQSPIISAENFAVHPAEALAEPGAWGADQVITFFTRVGDMGR